MSPGTNQSGLFVDLDGTLADSLGVLRATYSAFLMRFGIVGSQAEFESLNGPPLRTVVLRLKETHALAGDEAELYASYTGLLMAQYDSVSAHDGAEGLLQLARDSGRPVGVVTSASEALAGRWLERVHLRNLVDAVVGFERAGRGKPYPDPYAFALQTLRCAPERSFAVEDSRQGALSATAAGLRTLVVCRDEQPAPPEHWPQVEASMRSLREVGAYLEQVR